MRKPGNDSALLLSPEAPYPPAGGGALRTASIVEYLARNYELDLILFREPGAPDPSAALPPGIARRVAVIPLPLHARHALARAGRNFSRVLRGSPPLNDRFAGFASEVSAFVGGRRYGLAVIEHFWCAPYCKQLAGRCGRIVLDLHNVESALHRSCAEVARFPVSLAFRRFHSACAALERRWLPEFSLVLAASKEDAARVSGLCPARVYPNAIPLVPQPERPEEDVIVFSGNFEYHPNVSAVRFFRERIWPDLRARSPGLRWRLVGRNPEGVRRCVAGDPRIELTGPVPDAVHALAAAKVVVAPLLSGSGTRFKILEAWAAGRAVVSTTLGAEGLAAADGEHLLVADTPAAFTGAVARLLESPARRAALGRAGRSLYEREFTWPAAWRRLEELDF